MSIFDEIFGGRAASDELARKRLEAERAAAQAQAPLPDSTVRTAPVQNPAEAQTIDPTQLVPAPQLPTSAPPAGGSDDVGVLGRIFGQGDQTPDPNTGLTRSDRSQLGFGALAQLGGLLAAAGQPMAPADRARILAQLGGVASNTQQAGESIANQRRQRSQQDEIAKIRMLEHTRLLNKDSKEKAGPFSGTSMDAQARNIVLSGDPSTPEYASAYAHLAEPKVTIDQQSGQAVTVRPDMSWARRPTGMAQSPAGSANGQPSGTGVSVETVAGLAGRMTEGQANAALYADRMRQAEPIISANERAGLDPTGKALEKIPVAGNYAQSSEYQQLEQARRNFINATLRRESGAVISDEEFKNANIQYFPQPGDKPEVLKQKAANRRAAIDGISRAAGPSYKPTPDAPQPTAPSRADVEAEMRRRGLIK